MSAGRPPDGHGLDGPLAHVPGKGWICSCLCGESDSYASTAAAARAGFTAHIVQVRASHEPTDG